MHKTIDLVVKAWRMSPASALERGASPEQLIEAERALGRRFPDDFRALYLESNGGTVLQDNLMLYPLDGSELSVVHASDAFRNLEWPIPPELVVFANNGQGEQFGLWLPSLESRHTLVIEVGMIFEDGSYSITGTSLSAFLLGRSAYYLRYPEEPPEAIRLLGVPPSLCVEDPDNDDLEALCRWADPLLPPMRVASYDARLTADDIRREYQKLSAARE